MQNVLLLEVQGKLWCGTSEHENVLISAMYQICHSNVFQVKNLLGVFKFEYIFQGEFSFFTSALCFTG